MSCPIDVSQLSIDRNVDNNVHLSTATKLIITALAVIFFYFAITFYLGEDDSPKNSVMSLTPVANHIIKLNGASNSAVTATNTTAVSQQVAVLDASGHIVARRVATVSSRVTGKMIQLNIEEGLQVKQLEILAELDDKQAQIAYQLVLASLAQKQANFTELTIVKKYEQQRLSRQLALYKNALISEQVVDDTRFVLNKTDAQLTSRQAIVELSQQKVALTQYQLAQHKIRAPFDGVVNSKNAQVGELISTGASSGGSIRTGGATIVDMSSLEIEVEVGESYINRVFPGQQTVAILDAYPDWKITSEVVAIIPTADRQKASIKVRIKLFTGDNKILPDMGVKVSFYSTDPE